MKALFANQAHQLPPLYPFWHKEIKKGEKGRGSTFHFSHQGTSGNMRGVFIYHNDLGDNKGNTNIRWVGHGCEAL